MSEEDVFHFDNDKKSFDDFVVVNGSDMWYARDLMSFLGYTNYDTFFRSVINKAIATCTTSGIDVSENFKQTERDMDGKLVKDHKLTKFACYLVAMNGDTKKPQVARAQIYFAVAAQTLISYLEEAQNVERLLIRDDVSDREKSLSGVAKAHGVTKYDLFRNAGYRGMYNKNLNALKDYKGLKDTSRTLLDYMGKDELAANLFRLTQTEAKIKNDDIRGQDRLEVAAEMVGMQVRESMWKISNTRPENLPLAEDLHKVKSRLKSASKTLKIKGKRPDNKKLLPPKSDKI